MDRDDPVILDLNQERTLSRALLCHLPRLTTSSSTEASAFGQHPFSSSGGFGTLCTELEYQSRNDWLSAAPLLKPFSWSPRAVESSRPVGREIAPTSVDILTYRLEADDRRF